MQHVHIDRFFDVGRTGTVQRAATSARIVRVDSRRSFAFLHGVVIAEESAQIGFPHFHFGAE